MTAIPEPASRATRLAVLVPFAIVTLIWGSTWLVIRDQLGVVSPSWSVSYRFLVAGITMTLYALIRREAFRFDARGWAFAGAIGLSQFCLNFNFVYRAEAHVTSGLVAVVFALLFVPNAVFAGIFLGQRTNGPFVAGSAVAIAGVALLFLQEVRAGARGPHETLLGVGITLIATLCASTANVLQATRTAKAYPMIPTLAVAMLIGAALDAAIARLLTGPPTFEMRPTYIGGILYLGIFGSAIAFTLYFGVLRVIGPAKAAYSSVIVPVIAMLLSTLFEGYRWSPLAAVGAVLTGVGLVVALRARRPAR